MALKEMIEKYLFYCEHDLEFKQRSLERYRYLINLYQMYLIDFHNLSDDDKIIIPYLNGIKPDDILQSLEYYVTTRPVKSEDTVKLYISVIKEFLRYLRMKDTIECKSLFDSFGLTDKDSNSFSYLLNNKIVDFYNRGIITVRSNDRLLTDIEAKKIIRCCDDMISLSEIERLPDKEDGYNRYVKSLIIKLMLFIGVKLSPTVKNISLQDLDLDKGYLNINDYKILLPSNYKQQLKDYLSIRYKVNQDDSLFILKKVGNIEASDLTTILPYKMQIRSVTMLSKYAILNMLDVDIDLIAIKEVTEYGETVLQSCVELSNIDKDSVEQKVATLELYNEL